MKGQNGCLELLPLAMAGHRSINAYQRNAGQMDLS